MTVPDMPRNRDVTMLTDGEAQLAALLMNYDLDAPHVSWPAFDVGPEGEQRYGDFTTEQVRGFLAEKHGGDCTKAPGPCIRCFAEQASHQARWLMSKWEGASDE